MSEEPRFQLRKVMSSDFSEIHRWWKARDHTTFDEDELSELGAMAVSADGTLLAAVWLAYTNSKFAIIDWGVTNPNAPLRLRTDGLKAAYNQLRILATNQGFHYIFTFSGSRGLTRSLVKLGFTRNPEKQDVLIYSTKEV